MKLCKVGEARKVYKVFHSEMKSSERKPIWDRDFNKARVVGKKGSRRILSCVCMLLILQVFSVGSLEDELDHYVVTLGNVEIHNYLTIFTMDERGNPEKPVTLTTNPISLDDLSAFDRYDINWEKLKELRDGLVQKKGEENSQIDSIYPESGEILDGFIKIELKNHHVIYYDGIVLEHVIERESYEFESKGGLLTFTEPIGNENGHPSTLGLSNDVIYDTEEIRELLRKNNRTDSLSVELIYTEVTANRIIIDTNKRKLENMSECCQFLKDNWIDGRETTFEGGVLRFFIERFAFTCSENARTKYDRQIYRKIVLFYEIKNTLKEIGENLDKKEGVIHDLFKILENSQRTEFRKIFREKYEESIKDFVKTKYFLRKGFDFYKKEFCWTEEFDIEYEFRNISIDCEGYLSTISDLEKNFDLIKDLYVVEAYEEQIEEAQETVAWAQKAICVAVTLSALTVYFSYHIQKGQSRELQRCIDKIMRHNNLLERKRANISKKVTRYSPLTKMTRKGHE